MENKLKKPQLSYLAAALSIILLSGCNQSSDVNSTQEYSSGQFVGVEGLNYKSGSYTGVTGENGSFKYPVGESTIIFSVGGIELGQAKAGKLISLLDLVPEANGNISDQTVMNINRLLLTLDNDNNPDNGVVISQNVRQIANSHSFNIAARFPNSHVNNYSDESPYKWLAAFLEEAIPANPDGAPFLVGEADGKEYIEATLTANKISYTDPDDALNLHVPSPDWREQIIYFAFTDRFNDGDPSNNDQGAGVYDPTKGAKYSGGDLQGVIDKLDFIKGIGATAVWISQPVAGTWWDPKVNIGGYHGYWARDFKAIDEHVGTLATYKQLSHNLHENGMYLVQDVVVNHTGNFMTLEKNSDGAVTSFELNDDSLPSGGKPTQAPFYYNDYRDFEQRSKNIYHWNPKISDYKDRVQEREYQMGDLDDLNTTNEVVINALKDSYAYWIREVGVDAFRLDTSKFLDHAFWNTFLHSEDKNHPGMKKVARETNRDNFFAFGEVWASSLPKQTEGEENVSSFLGSAEVPEADANINFPLHSTMRRVFAGGEPTSYLKFRLEKSVDETFYPNKVWQLEPNFIENHDVSRFLSEGNETGLSHELITMMTVPGIPVLYQGSSQGLMDPRGSMFSGGYKQDKEGDSVNTKDYFDTETSLYKLTSELAELRLSNRVFTRGDLSVLAANDSGPGLIAYKRYYKDESGTETTAIVLINTAEQAVLANQLETGLASGSVMALKHAFKFDDAKSVTVDESGKLTMTIPANGAVVLMSDGTFGNVPEAPMAITLDDSSMELLQHDVTETITLTGHAAPASKLQLITDGYLGQGLDGKAIEFEADANGNFNVDLFTGFFEPDLEQTHTLAIVASGEDGQLRGMENIEFNSAIQIKGTPIVVNDPEGDDNGPNGAYGYPADSSFSHQQDVTEVDLIADGSFLSMEITMKEVTTTWKPFNGFDHVSFSIFFDIPGKEGLTVLPRLNAEAPAGFDWSFEHMAEGWGSRALSAENATADNWGDIISKAVRIDTNSTDSETGKVRFIYKGGRLGISNWEGVKVYITTWDYSSMDGYYRPLSPEGDDWTASGGAATDPKIMDSVMIEIPAKS
ncbi:alpha-amylase family glycosyl hydrolase [Vibrio sp. CAU 1672]|uniref:alpha-amylase family glycosyl hydrolase n=1 Tax=Vibrio sp. CAU 1672 TaxID=3032594 RepID=UPI0023DA5ADF|nr:alpha-amylase family glycosyl hydrolase [Vibrio sp. CAU 1672]MDF2154553.1 alpha-amylase family glycosyl hydrolase [Vibrio sp. CAU 1672]